MPENGIRQRIGIFGGTFDPIHVGHLLLAEQVREVLDLETIWFVPASRSPLKMDIEPTADKHRVAMLELATGGNPNFRVDDREIQRGGPSYTVETLRDIRQTLPNDELVFLMGADSLEDFHRWKDPQGICELAEIAVVARGGQAPPNPDLLIPYLPSNSKSAPEDRIISIRQMEISATEIRQRVAQGRSIRYQVHAAVEAYIAAEGLYTTS